MIIVVFLLTVQFLWWSDPFLEFYRKTETGFRLAHRTEVRLIFPSFFFHLEATEEFPVGIVTSSSLIRISSPQVVQNNLNPIWKPFRIPLRSLCGGDVESHIKATCFKVPQLAVHAPPPP